MTMRDPPHVPTVVKYFNLAEVKLDAMKDAGDWSILKCPESVLVLGLYNHGTGCLDRRVVIEEDLTANLYFGETTAKKTWNLEQVTVKRLLAEIALLSMCQGIQDATLENVKSRETEKFVRTTRLASGTLTVLTVMRSRHCQGFVYASNDTVRCSACSTLADTLLATSRAVETSLHHVNPKRPLASMTHGQLVQELKLTRTDLRNLEKLKKEMDSHSVSLPTDISDGLTAVFDTSHLLTHGRNHELMKLFWQEQKKAFQTDPRGMRWHPSLIRYAIFLHYQSPRAYEALRVSGVLRLPNKSTLREYTNINSPTPGFQLQAFEDLKKQAANLPEEKKFVSLLHDEMSIKSDLVYDRGSGDIVGFTNVKNWTFDDNLQDIEKYVATHVLVFMVVGINNNIKTSIAHFATRTCSGEDLYPILWKAVGYLEMICGLKVITSTSDKASQNQRLYRLHSSGSEEVVYKSANMFTDDDRHLYFISDPPHLLKTIRNNISRSKPGGTRYLWNNGKHILWSHVLRVFEDDQHRELHRTKLTYDHVHLTPSSTLSVRLAVQVLSRSVAQVLLHYYPDEMSETATVFLLCNRLFDCLNVRSLNEYVKTRNLDLAPYTTSDDPRFTFLKEECLGYFENWYRSTKGRQGFTKAEQSKMFLSMQTYQGIVMTVHAFCEAAQYLLNHGVSYVLSQHLCQDPLEEHFGRHRGLGARHTNPSVFQFGHQENQLRLQRSLALAFTPKGNTAGRKKDIQPLEISDSPLKKRKHCCNKD